MPSIISRSSLDVPRSTRRQRGPSHADRPRAGRDHVRREHIRAHERFALGRYTDSHGRPRELIAQPGLAESVLVVDRDAATLGDCRLVAHLGADEPPENATIVSGCYLRQVRGDGRRCRRLLAKDFQKLTIRRRSGPRYRQRGVGGGCSTGGWAGARLPAGMSARGYVDSGASLAPPGVRASRGRVADGQRA